MYYKVVRGANLRSSVKQWWEIQYKLGEWVGPSPGLEKSLLFVFDGLDNAKNYVIEMKKENDVDYRIFECEVDGINKEHNKMLHMFWSDDYDFPKFWDGEKMELFLMASHLYEGTTFVKKVKLIKEVLQTAVSEEKMQAA